MKKLCIYHGNCADGFTSAWVVRKALVAGAGFTDIDRKEIAVAIKKHKAGEAV